MGESRFKLVACDVDGTISDLETGIIPAEVRTAIHRIQSMGIPVVMTTGRAWVAAQEAAAQLGWTTSSEQWSDQSLLDQFKPSPATIDPREPLINQHFPREPLINHVSAAAHWIGRSSHPTSGDGRPVHVPDVGCESHPAQHVLARNSDYQHFPSQGEYFVCSNGAVVAQFPPLALLRLLTFEPGDVLDKLADIPHIMLAAEEFGVGYRVTRTFEPGLLQGKQTLVTLDDLRATPCLKIIAHLAEGVDDDLHNYIADIDFGDLAVFRGTSHWYDLCPPDTSKASGLKVITDRLGIDRSEVLAFGDGYNDIEILTWAGRGVALGDAPDEVRAAADAVTPTFREGGILPELTRWFG